MFAYVIIAIELAILYTVFWYIFLREPRPYRVKGNPWGGYDTKASHYQYFEPTIESDECTYARNNCERIETTSRTVYSPHRHLTAQQPQKLCVSGDLKYGWVVAGHEQREASAVAKLFVKFQQTLEGMSVKTP